MSRVHSNEEWENIINEYYSIYHTLDVPASTTFRGYNIGRWIFTKRDAMKNGNLSNETIAWLNSMNMLWETSYHNKNMDIWMQHFNDLKEFYENCGFSNIPERFVYKKFNLGKWLSKQREKNKKGLLDKDKISLLESIEVELENPINSLYSTSLPEQAIYFYMKKMFRDTKNRYCDLGFELDVYSKNANIAIEYDGVQYHTNVRKDVQKNNKCDKLGITLFRIRELGCPTIKVNHTYTYNSKVANSIEYLNNCLNDVFDEIATITSKKKPNIDIYRDMGKIISNVVSGVPSNWLKMFEIYKEVVEIEQTPLIPFNYVYKGYRVGGWISTQRQAFKGQRGIISATQKEMLDNVGFVWDVNDYQWNNTFTALKKFIKKNGYVPKETHVNNEERCLYDWIRWQRKRATNGTSRYKITNEQISKLEKVGVSFNVA